MIKVKKRNGKLVAFDIERIKTALSKAFKDSGYIEYSDLVYNISNDVSKFVSDGMSVEDVSDIIEDTLMDYDCNNVARCFILYRERQRAKREAIKDLDKLVGGVVDGSNEEAINENSNKNAQLNATQRDLLVGTYSRGYSLRNMVPTDLKEAHEQGLIHFHDLDYAITHSMFNCCLINLKDMFEHGTVINGKAVNTPHSINTACTIASQVVLQVSNNQYGGCSINIAHLAPFVRVTYNKWLSKYLKELGDKVPVERIDVLVNRRTLEDVDAGIQTLQYQLNTFSSLNGQSPFVSVFMYLNEDSEYIKETAILIESMLKLRYKGMENEFGVKTTPAFPKLLYVLDENNIHKDSEYYYLTQLAIKTTAKRMNPDFISAKMMKQYYEGNVFSCMGCRSFLSPWKDENGNYKFWGRFNRGVVSLNLPDIALTSKKNLSKFWEIFDDRLRIVKKALKLKHSWLVGSKATVSPIHWMHGAIARLNSEDTIDKYLVGGYSTISLGYIGLHECVLYMTGESIDKPKGHKLALKIMKKLHTTADNWKKEGDGLDGCGLYGTPSESLCYRFSRTLKSRFGEIPGITDKQWITNSYHIDVEQPIDAFDKLKIESEYQVESLGGAISYVEIPNMENNLEALEQVIDFMYENLIYAEINTRAGDSCASCGFEGEIECDDNGEWYCPQCGERNHNKLTVVRRTCGYIGSNYWNKGKTEEISKRVTHL